MSAKSACVCCCCLPSEGLYCDTASYHSGEYRHCICCNATPYRLVAKLHRSVNIRIFGVKDTDNETILPWIWLIEEAGSSISLVYIYQTTRRQIPADTYTELQHVRLLALRMIENNFLAKRKRVKVICVKGMRDDGGVEIRLHFFLTSTLDGQDLTPRPEGSWSKRLGGPQIGSRTSFDKSRSLSPAGNHTKIPTCLARSQVTIPTELSEHPECRLIYFNVHIQYIVQSNKMHLQTVLLHSHTC